MVSTDIPTVNTKKIILHDNNPFKIEAHYKLTLSGGPVDLGDYDYTGKSLYFLILDENQISKIVSPLRDRNTRNKIISEIFENNIDNLYSSGAAVFHSLEDLYSNENKIINTTNKQELHGSIVLDYDISKRERRKIDNTLQDFNYSFESLGCSKLHLVCFVGNSIDNLGIAASMGNINYDLLLEETITNQGATVLRPPKYRKSFFVDDINYPSINLRPYNGPAHYHSENNPGRPGYRDRVLSAGSTRRGYVGWMAGHAAGKMGPKLRLAESLNQKIQILGSLNKTLKLKIENSEKQHAPHKHPILEKHSNETVYTRVLQESENSINISDESHYGCMLGLNILNSLREKSVFAKYIEMHYQKGNQDILFSIIKRSKIIDLSVSRSRLQNGGVSKSGRNPKKRDRFSKNDRPVRLINTSDKRNRYNELQSVRNNKAAIHQVELSHPSFNLKIPNPYYIRMVNINDYDLFHNVKVGNYTYNIDLSIKDGAISYFKGLMKRLVVATVRMKKYQQISTEPAVYDSSHRLVSGNYDYQRMQSTGAFSSSTKYRAFLNRTTLLYAEVCKFLTGDNLNQEEVNNIRSCISPKTINIDYLESFILQLEASTEAVKEILTNNSSIVITPPEGNRNKASRYGDRLPHIPGVLEFKIKTNIDINTENKNHICTDHNIVSLRAKNLLSLSDISSNLASFYIDRRFKEPRRFVKIRTSPYQIDKNKVYKVNIRESQKAFKNNISQHNTLIDKGHVETMMEREEFYSSNYGMQSNFETKILALKQPGASMMGIDNKPESFYPTFLQSRSNSFVFTVSGFSDNFVYPEREQSALKELVYGVHPDATDNLIKTLHETLVTKSDPDEIEQIIEEKYHSLIKIKQRLGSLYSKMHLAFNIRKGFIKRNNKQKYKELYTTGRSTTASTPSQLEEERSVFSLEKAVLYSVVPGVGKVTLDPRQLIQMSNNLKRGGGQYLFIKVEHEDKSFKLPLINDGFLVEV